MGRISDWISIWRTQGSGGLVTEYSFGVCRDPADCWPNIYSVYAGVRRITDPIFIWWKQASGGLLTEYSFSVYRVQADYWPNIHLVYAGVRWISNWIFSWCVQGSGGFSDWIFIQCMNGSGGFPTEYSVGVCRDLVDYWSDIHLVYAQADYQLDIHWLH